MENGWEKDPKTGQRYRMVGNVKEYEMLISIDGIEVPESELEAYYEQKRAAEQARREAERNRPAPPPQRNCPFSDGLQTHCDREKCALFVTGCTLAQINDRPPAKDTEGLICPFSKYRSRCRADCALYESGCKITAIITNIESEDRNE